jgi:threonine dehydrogenase-like Zn-dependent dehydrogenase
MNDCFEYCSAGAASRVEDVLVQGEVLIEAKACGICGTDIRIWHDQFPYWPPAAMGHEFAGEIVPSLPKAGEGRRSKLSIASSPMGRR